MSSTFGAFLGKKSTRITQSNRLRLPVAFQIATEVHHPEDEGCFVATRFWDGQVLVQPFQVFRSMLDRLERIAQGHGKALELIADLGDSAFQAKIDSWGSIPLPPKFRKEAGIARSVVLTGNWDGFSIWDSECWQERQAEILANAGELLECAKPMPDNHSKREEPMNIFRSAIASGVDAGDSAARAAFTGRFDARIEPRHHRLTLPASCRETIEREYAEDQGHICVGLSIDGTLYIAPYSVFRATAEMYKKLPEFDKSIRQLQDHLLALVSLERIDSTKRIRLPSELMEIAAIDREVTLVGRGPYIEVTDRERFRCRQEEDGELRDGRNVPESLANKN